MAQYTEIIAGSDLTITNNINTFKYTVISSKLYLQQLLSGVTWGSIKSYSAGGLGKFRMGVRDGHWVIDETLDGTGFTGPENVSWKNIDKNKLG